ncbi:MAG: DUF2975 domain-containing protein [Akkermansiaceae bacterium]|nr:DUF2975 domain-containing protein [Akkermansiaceae bacterium]
MNENSDLKKKISRLGHVLLIVSCLGLLGALLFTPLMAWFTSPAALELTEFYEDEIRSTPLSLDTTVGELIEMDRSYAQEARSGFLLHLFSISVLYLAYALIFLRLAMAWRRAESFARPTIRGLRWLGLLHLMQFTISLIMDLRCSRPDHDIYLVTHMYQGIITAAGMSPVLSTGILLLILSWVLDYGRRLQEEQSLTI